MAKYCNIRLILEMRIGIRFEGQVRKGGNVSYRKMEGHPKKTINPHERWATEVFNTSAPGLCIDHDPYKPAIFHSFKLM